VTRQLSGESDLRSIPSDHPHHFLHLPPLPARSKWQSFLRSRNRLVVPQHIALPNRLEWCDQKQIVPKKISHTEFLVCVHEQTSEGFYTLDPPTLLLLGQVAWLQKLSFRVLSYE